jgi:hypothetical protein
MTLRGKREEFARAGITPRANNSPFIMFRGYSFRGRCGSMGKRPYPEGRGIFNKSQ